MSLGAVWTPCAGPMLAIICGGQYATRHVRLLACHAHRLQQVFGVLVMATALAMYLQYDVLAYAWAAAYFPSLKGL